MKFFDLETQYKILKKEMHYNIFSTIAHKNFILGPEVDILENKLKKLVGSKFCITTSSGTDSLLISLMALGIEQGDEVITSAYTYISSLEMICLIGAKPVLVDVNKFTANIDYKILNKKINSRTKAIIVTSLYGNPADFKEINLIAKKKNIKIIEDAAQSFGSIYKNKKSCNLSDIGCTSFFPTKVLSCYGDGGAIFTNSNKLQKIIKEIRIHGQSNKFNHKRIGICGRMDSIQCSILLSKLKIFNTEMKLRKKISLKYSHFLTRDVFQKKIYIIKNLINTISNHYLYTIVTKKRKELIKNFLNNNIPYKIYYYKSLDKQTGYKKYFLNQKYDNANFLSKYSISIPSHPYLKDKDQNKIINVIKKTIY